VWDSPTEATEFFDVIGQAVEKRYKVKTTSAPGATTRAYSGAGRSVEVTTTDVAGRPVVLYVDVPAGASTHVLDVTKVELKEATR
jgi:hypothetical protein